MLCKDAALAWFCLRRREEKFILSRKKRIELKGLALLFYISSLPREKHRKGIFREHGGA